MSGQHGAPRYSLEELLQARLAALERAEGQFPLFVYSYSSRGFPDLRERYAATHQLAPAQLISLYDLHYSLLSSTSTGALSDDGCNRFVDSGGYEVYPTVSSYGLEGAPGQRPW